MTNTAPRPNRRWRRPKRLTTLAAGFALGLTAALAPATPSSTPAPTEVASRGDATLSLSMVDLRGTETVSDPITLSELQVVGHQQRLSGWDGTGIDVALIDSGVAPVDGLDGANVIHGPDLSGEGAISEVAYLDTYGHGTHMAGIIAGQRTGHEGVAPTRGSSASRSPAPMASLRSPRSSPRSTGSSSTAAATGSTSGS